MANGNGNKVPKTLDKLDNDMERAMVVAFMVQMHGKITVQALKKEIAEKLGFDVHLTTLKNTCEALKKGQFITLELMQTERGDSQLTASMRTTVFPAVTEIAMMPGRNFLPRLRATEGAEKIKAWFENEEKASAAKAENRLKYKHIHTFTIVGIMLDDIIGGLIPCQRSDDIRKKFPDKNIEQTFVIGKKAKKGKKGKKAAGAPAEEEEIVIEVSGLFMRCPLTGAYIIPSDIWRGWWSANAMRYADMPKGAGEHAAFSPVYINPKLGVTQLVLPVQSDRGPAQPKAYECISAGEEITLTFSCPTTGYLHPAQIEKLVLLACMRPKRGFSHARGVRFGRLLITSFTDHGPVNGMPADHCGAPPFSPNPTSLDHLLNGLPPLSDEQMAYTRDAVKRLATVALGDGTPKGSKKPAPFPVLNGNGNGNGDANGDDTNGDDADA